MASRAVAARVTRNPGVAGRMRPMFYRPVCRAVADGRADAQRGGRGEEEETMVVYRKNGRSATIQADMISEDPQSAAYWEGSGHTSPALVT